MTAHPSLAMPHRMDGFPILHTDDTDAFAPSRIDAFRCMRTVLYVSFRLLFGLLLALDFIFISSYLHEGLYRFLALSPRLRTERKRDCHGDDDLDLGRHIALDFSELGYTAFALLPDRPAATSAPDASNVSLLIQEWHKKKRSGHSASSCGLVAPIVLDMNSSPQRTRAFETVDAYCAAHSLHLVAIIMQPATEFITSKPQFQPGRAGLNPSAWGDVVRQCLVVPLSVV